MAGADVAQKHGVDLLIGGHDHVSEHKKTVYITANVVLRQMYYVRFLSLSSLLL